MDKAAECTFLNSFFFFTHFTVTMSYEYKMRYWRFLPVDGEFLLSSITTEYFLTNQNKLNFTALFYN